MGRNEQMAEGMQLSYVVGLAERILHAGFQNGSIGLVEIAFWSWRDDGLCIPRFCAECLCL